jgi:hypothetical protein
MVNFLLKFSGFVEPSQFKINTLIETTASSHEGLPYKASEERIFVATN